MSVLSAHRFFLIENTFNLYQVFYNKPINIFTCISLKTHINIIILLFLEYFFIAQCTFLYHLLWCVISMNAFPWVWIQPEGHLPEMLTEPVGIQACTWVLTIELNHVARHSVPLMVPTTDADETNYTAQKYYKRLYLALNRQPNLYLQQNIKDNILNNILNNNILVTKPFWLRLTSNSWTNLFIFF